MVFRALRSPFLAGFGVFWVHFGDFWAVWGLFWRFNVLVVGGERGFLL